MLKSPRLIMEPDTRFKFLRHHDQAAGQIRDLQIEDLYAQISPLNLNRSIPLAVRQHFDAARYAFLYSWFAYDLATLAEFQAYTALEMALRHKLKDETGRVRPAGLRKLLEKATEKGWLIADDFVVPGSADRKPLSYLEVIVQMRNKLAHGEAHLHPDGSVQMMKICARILNALYADEAKTSSE